MDEEKNIQASQIKITSGKNLGANGNTKNARNVDIGAAIYRHIKSKRKIYFIVIIVLIIILIITVFKSFNGNSNKKNGEKYEESKTADSWTKYRLPKFISPIHYDIFLKPVFTTSTYTGNISIQFNVLKERDYIVLHMVNLLKNKITIKSNGIKMEILKEDPDIEMGQLFLKINEFFKPNQSYVLEIAFQGHLNESYGGFFVTSYKSGDETRKIAYTNFKPIYARKAFPCFDEPAMKATFQLTIEHDRNYIAYFNTPIDTTSQHGDNTIITKFHISKKISTYVVAFALCDYTFLETKKSMNKSLSVLVPTKGISECCNFVSSNLINIVLKVKQCFQTENSFPFEKFDLMAVPILFESEMENWGLAFFPQISLYSSNKIADINSKERNAFAIARVFSHYYLGDIVSVKWWSEFWIAEGFAIFIQYFALDETGIFKNWKMMEQFIVDIKQRALYIDSFKNNIGIYTGYNTNSKLESMFDVVNYRKGASIINMLQDVLGKVEFLNLLRAFWKKYAYSSMNTNDFLQALPQNVFVFMYGWINFGGYSIVYANLTMGKIQLEQKRFNLGNPDNKSNSFLENVYRILYIPLKYITSTDREKPKTIWLNYTKGEFDIKNGNEIKWIKLNAGSIGFYRVMYSIELWDRIIEDINDDHNKFGIIDRSDLLDDVFTFAQYNALNVDFAIKLSKYLEKETHFLPWKTALHHLHYMHNMLFNTSIAETFKLHVRNLINPIVTNILALEANEMEDHNNKKLCTLVLPSAVKFNHVGAINKAKELFASWKTAFNIDNPEMLSLALNGGVANGSTSDWEKCWEYLMTTKEPSHIKLIIEAMAQTYNKAQLEIYLNYSLNSSKLDAIAITYLFPALGKNAFSCSMAWNFLKTHMQYFTNLYKSYRIPRHFMSVLIQNLNTKEEYDEAKIFILKKWPKNKYQEIYRALESLNVNINWKQNVQESVSNALQNQGL